MRMSGCVAVGLDVHVFAGTSIAHIQKKGVGSAIKVFRRPLGKSSRPWLYGSSSIQTIAAMAVCDTTRSTMHDCDMLSDLQTHWPCRVSEHSSAHHRNNGRLGERPCSFACRDKPKVELHLGYYLLPRFVISPDETFIIRTADSRYLDTCEQAARGKTAHTRSSKGAYKRSVLQRFGKSSRPWLHGKPCHEKIAALAV